MSKEVTHVSLPIDVLNRALNYLATKPFNEVYELISAIKSSADASFAEQQASRPED